MNSTAQKFLSPDFPREIKRKVFTPNRERWQTRQSCLVQPGEISQGSLQEHRWLKARCTMGKFHLWPTFYLFLVYVCACPCMGGYMYGCKCACALYTFVYAESRRQCQVSSFKCHVVILVETGFLLAWNVPIRLGWPTSESQECACLCLPSSRITSMGHQNQLI